MPDLYNLGMVAKSNDAPESREQIGARLILVRDALGLSQKEFAAAIGITNTRLEGYESGRNLIKPEVAVRVIKVAPEARIDFNWLYHGDMGGLSHAFAESIKELIAANVEAA